MTKILIDEAVVRQGDDAIVSYFAAANHDEKMEAEDALLEFRFALCQALADAALDKMADNARELGLDYE